MEDVRVLLTAHVTPFEPRATWSITRALTKNVRGDRVIRGAHEHRGAWRAWICFNAEKAFLSGFSRQAAAVAADLVTTLQRHSVMNVSLVSVIKAFQREYNVVGVEYEEDDDLVEQLKCIVDARGMKAFLEVVLANAMLSKNVLAKPVRTRRRKQKVPRRAMD